MLELIGSRRFWVALVALILIIVQAFIPDFNLNTEDLVGLVLIVVPMIIGLTVDPGDPAEKWKGLLRSRKFFSALVGILMIILTGLNKILPFGLTSDQLVAMCLATGSLIIGFAFEGKYRKEIEAAGKYILEQGVSEIKK
jgi:hypothetical protein